MTKFKLGVAAAAAAILAFGVAACGQTATTPEETPAAVEESTTEAPAETPAADPAATTEAPADAAPAETTPPATTP